MLNIDFTKTGGMPFTQDLIKMMQNNALDALDVLAGIPVSDKPYVLSGVELVSGNWVDGVVSAGWVYIPGEGMMYFEGGVIDANNRSYYTATDVSDLEFKTGGPQGVIRVKSCKIAPGVSPRLRDLSENRYVDVLNEWTAWEEIVPVLDYPVTEAKLLYRRNKGTKTIEIRGRVVVGPSGFIGAIPEFQTLTIAKNIVFGVPVPDGRGFNSLLKVRTPAGQLPTNAFSNQKFSHGMVELILNSVAFPGDISPILPDGKRLIINLPYATSEIVANFEMSFGY